MRPNKSRNNAVLVLTVVLFVCASSAAQNSEIAAAWKPTAELVAQLEGQIHLPKGASPLLS
jgi:hypothetical protein